MFKNCSRHERKKKTQVKLLQIKTTKCDVKNTLNRINSVFDIAKEKINSLEDREIETLQKKPTNKKRTQK